MFWARGYSSMVEHLAYVRPWIQSQHHKKEKEGRMEGREVGTGGPVRWLRE